MLLFDKIRLPTARTYTDEGFLTAPARIARTGVQMYSAASMEVADQTGKKEFRVYRSPEEVFAADSLKTFSLKPVTNGHPPVLVTKDNVREYQVGMSGPVVVADGDYVTATLTVTDGNAIEAIKSGKAELSNGYVCDIDWTPGVTESGQEYDAQQRNIRGNHIALVTQGRAGPLVKVADDIHTPTHTHTEESTMETITIDGVQYEVTKQVAQAIAKSGAVVDKLQATLDATQASLDDAVSKIPTPEQMDELVAKRESFIAKCKTVVADVQCAGKSVDTIKKEIVAAKCPTVNMDSVTVDYVNARFDILIEGAETADSSVTDALKETVTTDTTDTTDTRTIDQIARDKMIEDSRNAWQGKGE